MAGVSVMKIRKIAVYSEGSKQEALKG